MPEQGIPTPPGYKADDIVDAPQSQAQTVPLPPGYSANDVVDLQSEKDKATAKAQNDQHVEDFVHPKGMLDRAQQAVGNAIPESAVPALEAVKKYAVDPFDQLATWGHEYGSKYMEKGAAYHIAHPIKGAVVDALGTPFASMIMGDQSDVDKLEKEHAIIAGVAKGVGGTAGSIVADPRNWPLMSASEAMPVLDSLMKGPFAIQMTYGAGKALESLKENWDKLTPEERSQEITESGLQAVFAEEAVRHAHVRQAVAKTIVDHVAKHADVGMSSTTTSQGAEIPVQSDTLGGKLARQVTSPEVTKGIAQNQTAPAVQQAVGDIAKNVTGSRVDTEVNPESGDHFGLRAHATDLKAQAQPAWQYIDKLSNNKFTEAQQKIDQGYAVHDPDLIREGRKEKQVLTDTFREDLADKGLDIDTADRQYRRGKQLEKVADSFNRAIDPGTGNLNGKRLSEEIGKLVNKGDEKNPLAKADFTPEHIKSLQEVADIMKDEEKVPIQFLSSFMKAGTALIGFHGVGLGGALAEHLVEPQARNLMDNLFAKAMSEPSSAKVLPEALRTGNAQPVVNAIEKNDPGWLKRLFKNAGSQRGSISWGGGIDQSDVPRTPGIRRGKVAPSFEEKRTAPREEDADQVYMKLLQDRIAAGGPDRLKAVNDLSKLQARIGRYTPDETGSEARAQAGKTRKMSQERVPANPNAPARELTKVPTIEESIAARKSERARVGAFDLKSQRGGLGLGIDQGNEIQKPGIRRGKYKVSSKDMHAAHQENGGATFDDTGDLSGKDAWSVGAYPERTESFHDNEFGPDKIDNFAEKNQDRRGVALGSSIHDEMLGGKATDKNPPREQFVAEGGIRIRPRSGKGGREFSISIPESGITKEQLSYLQKMAPQMSSGEVHLEVGKPDGDYRKIEYGKASRELESKIKELVPVKGETVGTPAATKSDNDNWNQAKQELGKDASFSQIATRAQEIKDGVNTKPDMSSSEIATRYPTSVKADTTNNPANTTGMEAVEQADKISPPRNTQSGKPVLGIKQKLALSLSDYMDNGLRFTGQELANPDKVINKVVGHVADNLTWLHDNMPASIKEKAKQWYDSAHDLTKKWADQYGFSHEQAAATVAALSPNNPWDNNVGQAERLMQHVAEDSNHAWTPEMDNAALKIRNSDAVNAAFGRMINDIRGKTLDQLTAKTPEALLAKKAIWYRILDEAHGSESTPVYSPDGSVRGSTKLNWGQVEPMAKALSILGNGDLQHIHDVMGQGHKIRNFYNNIINPNSERGHVTIDTHAVGAGYLKPFSQEDTEVAHNFGSGNRKGIPSPPKHAETGLKGTYPVYEEAYKQAAEKLGIRPRELQSITWEGIRSLMGDDKKTPELRRAVTDIWRAHESGDITLNQAREEIVKASGGFTKPEWMRDEDWDGEPEQGNTSFDFGEPSEK